MKASRSIPLPLKGKSRASSSTGIESIGYMETKSDSKLYLSLKKTRCAWWADLINLNEFVLYKVHFCQYNRGLRMLVQAKLFIELDANTWSWPEFSFVCYISRTLMYPLTSMSSCESRNERWHRGTVVASTILVSVPGWGPFCVDLACSPCVYVGSLLVVLRRIADLSKVNPCQCQLGWVTTFRDYVVEDDRTNEEWGDLLMSHHNHQHPSHHREEIM